jgi:hypothetical protein
MHCLKTERIYNNFRNKLEIKYIIFKQKIIRYFMTAISVEHVILFYSHLSSGPKSCYQSHNWDGSRRWNIDLGASI